MSQGKRQQRSFYGLFLSDTKNVEMCVMWIYDKCKCSWDTEKCAILLVDMRHQAEHMYRDDGDGPALMETIHTTKYFTK